LEGERDELRRHAAGMEATVQGTDSSDMTAQCMVPGVGTVWLGLQALTCHGAIVVLPYDESPAKLQAPSSLQAKLSSVQLPPPPRTPLELSRTEMPCRWPGSEPPLRRALASLHAELSLVQLPQPPLSRTDTPRQPPGCEPHLPDSLISPRGVEEEPKQVELITPPRSGPRQKQTSPVAKGGRPKPPARRLPRQLKPSAEGKSECSPSAQELAAIEAHNLSLKQEIAAVRERMEQKRLRQEIVALRERLGSAPPSPVLSSCQEPIPAFSVASSRCLPPPPAQGHSSLLSCRGPPLVA